MEPVWMARSDNTAAYRVRKLQLAVISLPALVVLFCLIPCYSVADEVAATSVARVKPVEYSFGVVPQFEQRRLFSIWLPILAELEKRTGLVFKLKGSSRISVFEDKIEEGQFDFAYMNPYQIVKASQLQGYIPLVKDGTKQLRGVLVVQKNSKITEVSQLDGKEVVFPSPNSLGATLMMRADFQNKFKIHVRPHYVQTHSSVYLHVAKGLALAGGGVQQTLEKQSVEIRHRLRVIYRTNAAPPHPIAVHPRVPETDRIRVQKALLKLSKSPEGKKLFARIPMHGVTKAAINDYTKLLDLGLDKIISY